jgi:hypothetical protein
MALTGAFSHFLWISTHNLHAIAESGHFVSNRKRNAGAAVFQKIVRCLRHCGGPPALVGSPDLGSNGLAYAFSKKMLKINAGLTGACFQNGLATLAL